MRKFTTAIIGGGASGILAAISAARCGQTVVIIEKMPCLGKKILASGNGRCNLLNDRLDESFYNREARPLVKSVFDKFTKQDILKFFNSLGLYTRSENGRIFPVTNQASTVVRLLEMEVKRQGITVELAFDAVKISKDGSGFIINPKKGSPVICRKIVFTGGGRSYPALGSDGSAYRLASDLGHTIVEPVPACVSLLSKNPALQHLQGQRISAETESIIDGAVTESANGEVLFTKYGLSGSAILDISESISIAINREGKKSAEVSIDAAPFITEEALGKELSSRRDRGFPENGFLTGILPNKFSLAFKNPKAKDLKCWRFKISGTRGWNEAEFTAGGIDLEGVDETTLESKITKGLFFAGEVLNVNGRRGGYNLAWAWASGFVAGSGK